MSAKKQSGGGDSKCKEDGYQSSILNQDGRVNVVNLIALLHQKDNGIAKPSIFNNEMQVSAEDRIEKLLHSKDQFALKGNDPRDQLENFRVSPRIVIFQNFYLGKQYKMPVSVMNSCKVMKPLHTSYEESQFFSITYSSGMNMRIAPGMAVTLIVNFTPEERKDYFYQITLKSDKECFNIPVIAIGPRPLLDLPDDIYIPAGPLKIRSSQVIIVKNIGDVSAIFSLITISPFFVEPKKGVLRPSEMMHIKVSVIPSTYGNIEGELKICHETGENIISRIHGVGEEANAWMDKNDIVMEDSYMGVKQVTSLTLHNESSHVLTFKWKKFQTSKEEFLEYDKLMNGYSFLKNLEESKYSTLSKGDVIDPVTHSQVYDRMYDDEIRALRHEEFLFRHSSFSLKPLTGDIWPNSSVDVTVVFEPDRPGKHHAIAYCDLPGYENRLPLNLRGKVKGPQFAFNLDVLDIDCVFVSKTHNYEIVVKNVGIIPGTIIYVRQENVFGEQITCNPEEISLMPEECKPLTISFNSNVQGEFKETIAFQVQESEELFKIEIKGCVILPTLNFNEKEVDFGLVPVGFPSSYAILLQNLSMVPVNYKLGIKGDGYEPSISFKKYSKMSEKPRISKNPKEYAVSPPEGSVSAYSSVKVTIILTPNIVREKRTSLTLSVVDAISTPIRLPVKHNAAIPTIVCTPDFINIRFCFINYPYTRNLVLENQSDVIGFFHILPQPRNGTDPMEFSTTVEQGIIKPRSERKVPINIVINSLGKQQISVSMLTLGDDAPKDICTITGIGQGPVVTVDPNKLDYGKITLLEYVSKNVLLTNDSPVPAEYSISLMKKNPPWTCTPESGILPAECCTVIEVTVMLRDRGKYKDSLEIDVQGSRTLRVVLIAEGIGTNLVFSPQIYPTFDFGFLLTNQPIEKKFSVSNEGNKFQTLRWSANSFLEEPIYSRKESMEDPKRTIFQFQPQTMHMNGRCSENFTLFGFSEIPQSICERFYGILSLHNKKEVQIITDVLAKFVDPKVAFSKPELIFKINISSGEKFQILHDNVDVSNLTDLTYNVELRTDFPFSIMADKGPVQSLPVVLHSSATIKLTVLFDSSIASDCNSRSYSNNVTVHYGEHHHPDYLPLYGEVNFPNVKVEPEYIDFGCIPLGCSVSKQIKLTNKGFMPINYEWFWLGGTSAEKVHEETDYKDSMDSEEVSQIEVLKAASKAESKMGSDESQRSSNKRNLKETPGEVSTTKDEDKDEGTEKSSSIAKSKGSEIKTKDQNAVPEAEVPDGQVKENIPPGVDELNEMEGDEQLKKPSKDDISDCELKASLFPVLARYFDDDTEEQALQGLSNEPESGDSRNEYFEITPCLGQLGPYETITISIRFSGKRYASVKGVLIVKVNGGPTQGLFVKGQVSDLHYKISTTFIDVGYQIFCLPSSNLILLTNTGCLPFHFNVDFELEDVLPTLAMRNEHNQRSIKVKPSSGLVEGKHKRQLTVEVHPGAVKKFYEPFKINIGFLDPITIIVQGYGVIPQIYAFLPRPKSYTTPPDIGFKAVDSLMTKKFPPKVKDDKDADDSALFGRNIPEKEIKSMSEKGWVIVTYEDDYPTVADIDLAIERKLAQEHLNKLTHTFVKTLPRNQSIPGLDAPPYTIDFGIVCVETTVSYSVLLYNYGPVVASAVLRTNPRKSVIRNMGFRIKIPDMSKFQIDQTVSMQIIFNPSKQAYHEKQTIIHFTIYIEVFYGARVPIEVHAAVTVPYVVSLVDKVDFGTIKCGERKIITILLANEGLVPCSWKGEARERKEGNIEENLNNIKSDKLSNANIKNQKRGPHPIFSFQARDYTLMPSQFIPVELIFFPNAPGIKDGVFEVRMESNISSLLIPLRGDAIEPRISLSNTHISFEPTLPCSDQEVRCITVKNPLSLPVEFFLPHLDRQVQEEERILRVLCDYYEQDHLCLPLRHPGDRIPQELYSFYESLVSMMNALVNSNDSPNSSLSQRKQSKQRSAGSNTSGRGSTFSSFPRSSSPKSHPDLEEKLLHENMPALRKKFKGSTHGDPVSATHCAINAARASLEDFEPEVGTMLIFYGAPLSDFMYHAHRTSRILHLKEINIDEVIVEAAALSQNPECIKLRDKINALYEEQEQLNLTPKKEGKDKKDKNDKKNKKEEKDEENQNKDEDQDTFIADPVEEMNKRVTAIARESGEKMSSKSVKRGSLSARDSGTKPQSQSSNRRSTSKKSHDSGSIPGIPIDIYEDILRKRFMLPECQKGVLISTLKCSFFDSAETALTILLRAGSFFKYIHCIFFYNSYEKYAKHHAAEKEEAEAKTMHEIEDKKGELEKMTVEDMDSLPESDQAMWEKLHMDRRKEDWNAKKGLNPLEVKQKQKEKEKEEEEEARLSNRSPSRNEANSQMEKKHTREKSTAEKKEKDKEKGKEHKEKDKKKKKGKKKHKSDEEGKDEKEKRKKKKQTMKEDKQRKSKKDKGKRRGSGKDKGDNSEEEEEIIDDEIASLEPIFRAFEVEYNELLNICMGWDRKKGLVSSSSPSKSIKSIKSVALKGKKSVGLKGRGLDSKSSNTLKESDEDSIITWIFDCSKPDTTEDEFVAHLLNESEEFTSSRFETNNSPKQLPAIIHSCIPKPKEPEKLSCPEVFIFCSNEREIGDPMPEGEYTETVRSRRKSARSVRSVRSVSPSIRPESSRLSPREGRKTVTRITRWILKPRERMKLCIQFDPTIVGEYNCRCPIGVLGWDRRNYINLEGICDIPRIDTDPNVLFDHVVPRKDHEKIYRLTYYLRQEYFDFGAVLVTKKEKRVHHVATTFNISNCSTLDVEARFSFLDKKTVDSFELEPMYLKVQPGKTEKLTVFAFPRVLGLVNETIICSITDNPMVEHIKISCTGVKVEFDVEPKVISFTHVLIFRKDFRIIKLKNESLVPVIWHLVGLDDDFLEHFDISSTEGLIMPLDYQDVRIEFFATQSVPCVKRNLKIHVFDEEGRGDPLCIQSVQIIAESVDVMVDILFQDSAKNYVDFGNVKVGCEYTQPIYLRNRGKYDVNFRLEVDIPSNFRKYDLHKILSVVPPRGVIPIGERLISVDAVCHPLFDIHVYAVPVFKLYLLDEDTIVAIIPIQVSVTAQHSRFDIQPRPEINFGAMAVGSKKLLQIFVKNYGSWDITYNVMKDTKETKNEDVPESLVMVGSRTSGMKDENHRSSSSKQKRPKKNAAVTVQLGIFSITPIAGTVAPGETATLQVECEMENPGTFAESVRICIPEHSSTNTPPETVRLLAEGSVPNVNFSDFESIFGEHFVCQNLDELDCPTEIYKHSIYIKDERKFLFSHTCLETTNTVQLKFQNPGYVPCNMLANVSNSPILPKHIKSHSVFAVAPYKFCIPPYELFYIEITFTPAQIGTYSGTLSVEYNYSENSSKFSISLEGEGCVPMISLLEPLLLPLHTKTEINYGPTLLGRKSKQKLIVQNSGTIDCEVNLEVSGTPEKTFTLSPTEETTSVIDDWKPDAPSGSSLRGYLQPNFTAVFEVKFEPGDVGKFTAVIKITIVGNPYEEITVKCTGESYVEDLTLDLPSTIPEEHHKQASTLSTEETDHLDDPRYFLNFGYCYIGTSKKIAFKINNHSRLMYRFEYPKEKIKFIPRVGHLKPNSSKKITAIFTPTEPSSTNQETMNCRVSSIVYVTGIPEGTTWDDRVRTTQWKDLGESEDEEEGEEGDEMEIRIEIPKLDVPSEIEVIETDKRDDLKRKVIDIEEEPIYTPLPENPFNIELIVSGVADYATYICDIVKCDFEDTLMFQSRVQHFTLQNHGHIPLPFIWNVVMDEHYPVRPPSQHQLSTDNSTAKKPDTPAPSSVDESSQNRTLSIRTMKLTKEPSARKMMIEKNKEDDVEYDEYCQEAPDKEYTSDIFSTSGASSITQDTWAKSSIIPFKVEPQNGTIEPGQQMKCEIIFAPTEVYNYKVIIIALIPYLHPDLQQPKIIVRGRSLMPFCHFKIDESDYLTSGRRDLSFPGPVGLNTPLDLQTKVIECKVVGIGDTHTEKFIAVNPTEIMYRYHWENLTSQSSQNVSMFYIPIPRGAIDSRCEMLMSYNFIACDTGTYESFWNFIIPDHDIKILFLFVAHVSEPNACFLTSHITLCPTIVGLPTEKHVSLISHEDTTLSFEFDHNSVFTEGQIERLEVKPMKGKIYPGEEALIKIKYTPKHPSISHFELKCQIKGMKKPLTLGVTGECYGVQPIVTYEYQPNEIVTLNPTEINIIDFGEVCVKYPQNILFRVTNIGKVTFYFYWEFDEQFMKRNKIKIAFHDRGGHVTSQSRVTSNMTWMFLTKNELVEMHIILQIKKGPEYKIVLKGKSIKPFYTISPMECNFGLCFFKETVDFSYKKVLNVCNFDTKPILIECTYTNTDFLTIENGNGPIHPDEEKEVLLILCPQGIKKYEERVEFIINGCFKENVKVLGESIDLQVGLQNPQNKLTVISPVLPGAVGYACIPVANNGRAEVLVQFGFGEKMLEVVSACPCGYEPPISKDKNKRIPLIEEPCNLSHNNDLEITPNNFVHLKPGGVVNIGVKFRPLTRIKMFSKKICMKIFHHTSPLCIVQGSCVGPEFSLDRNSIPFGSVYEGCTSSQKVKLLNSGEVGARFHWKSGSWKKIISIDPMRGYSSPDSETTFTVKLCSKTLQRNINYVALCVIGEEIILNLTLTGSCSENPIAKETIQFNTPVRMQDKQTLPLSNTTGIPWNIFPRITGKYFLGPENVQVPAYSTIRYDVMYSPLTMTGQGEHHEGTLTFCIPGGQALSYALTGTAGRPVSSGKITREIPCKEKHTESLKVINWLTTSQRFHVTNEVAKPEKMDPIFFLSGNEYIDVPGKSTRVYKWNFFCYKECTLNIKVFFTNIVTNEYSFYELVIKVVKRGPLQVIELNSRVRLPVSSKITLENPLNVNVQFHLTCSSPEIHLNTPVVAEAFSEKIVEFEYTPLFVGESIVLLEANNTELGTFPYQLNLFAMPPLPEQLIKCSTFLGSSETTEAIIQNMSKLKAEFNIKIDNPDFEAEKIISVSPNSKGVIVITFEPTTKGNVSGTLKATSSTAGSYEFPLLGIGTDPVPQGPFFVKTQIPAGILFKNVFRETLPFNITTEGPFSTKPPVELIRPKKEIRIGVNVLKDAPSESTGKLVIRCKDSAKQRIKWVYYLKKEE